MNALILGPAIAAAIAALGYVGKLIVESWRDGLREVRERRARLASLYSLLMASKSVFETPEQIVPRARETGRGPERRHRHADL